MKKILFAICTFLFSIMYVFADSFYLGIETDKDTVAPGDTLEVHYVVWCPDPTIEAQEFTALIDFDEEIFEIPETNYELREGWQLLENGSGAFLGKIRTDDFYSTFTEEEVEILKGEECQTQKFDIYSSKFKVKETAKNQTTKLYAVINNVKYDSKVINVYKKSNNANLATLTVDNVNIKLSEDKADSAVIVPYDSTYALI